MSPGAALLPLFFIQEKAEWTNFITLPCSFSAACLRSVSSGVSDMRYISLFFLFLSQSLFAAEYSWLMSDAGYIGRGSSPSEALTEFCKVHPAYSKGFCDSGRYTLTKYNETLWQAKFYFPASNGGGLAGTVNIARSGDSCPPDTTYDPVTGRCANACKDKPPMPFSKSGTAPDSYVTIITINGKPTSTQATQGCFSGCVASTTDQKCSVRTSGLYTCKGTAYFSGQSCTSGPADLSDTPDAKYPEPETISEEKPCTYTTSADGSQQCTSSKSTEKEGQMCGTVNGERVCVDKSPTKNGVEITTNVSTVTNPDGSKTTTKTDTAKTTTCTAVKSCITKATTVTTTVKTDGNGKVTSTTGSCSGANCPDSNTDPDGNGDGFGDCVGGQCGEEEGAGGDAQTPELGEVDGYQATTQKFFDKVKQSPLATSVGSISAPTSGSRPDFTTDGIAFLGGVSLDFGIIGTIWEDVKHVLSLTMRAVWCFIAIVIFFSA